MAALPNAAADSHSYKVCGCYHNNNFNLWCGKIKLWN